MVTGLKHTSGVVSNVPTIRIKLFGFTLNAQNMRVSSITDQDEFHVADHQKQLEFEPKLKKSISVQSCSNFSPLGSLGPGIVLCWLLVIVPHCEGWEASSCPECFVL